MPDFLKKKLVIVLHVERLTDARRLRGDIDEALDAVMAYHKHGVRVVGGGAMMAPKAKSENAT